MGSTITNQLQNVSQHVVMKSNSIKHKSLRTGWKLWADRQALEKEVKKIRYHWEFVMNPIWLHHEKMVLKRLSFTLGLAPSEKYKASLQHVGNCIEKIHECFSCQTTAVLERDTHWLWYREDLNRDIQIHLFRNSLRVYEPARLFFTHVQTPRKLPGTFSKLLANPFQCPTA